MKQYLFPNKDSNKIMSLVIRKVIIVENEKKKNKNK
jgi:hypothetical protein